MIRYGRNRHKKKPLIKILTLIVCALLCIVVLICFKHGLCKCFNNFTKRIINITDAYIHTVTIIGASPNVEKLIKANLGVKAGDSIFSVSTMNMLNNLSKIGWIKEATIHKILPNAIKIEIKMRIPIAVYHSNKKYTLIDKEGILITGTQTNPGLPLVSGIDANVYTNDMLMLLKKYPKIKAQSLIYVQKRRWNLVLKNRVTVKLPNENVEKALEILSSIIEQKNITDAITAIDLRVPENVIINGLKAKPK